MPGSIVRVDRCYTHRMKDAGRGSMDDRFWLVEQPERTHVHPGAMD